MELLYTCQPNQLISIQNTFISLSVSISHHTHTATTEPRHYKAIFCWLKQSVLEFPSSNPVYLALHFRSSSSSKYVLQTYRTEIFFVCIVNYIYYIYYKYIYCLFDKNFSVCDIIIQLKRLKVHVWSRRKQIIVYWKSEKIEN